MADTDKLALVSQAADALKVSSELPANKAITVSEMEAMIPPLKAVTSESYHQMISGLIDASSTSIDYRLVFVENKNGKACKLSSGYGGIDLSAGSYGGWYAMPNASGWDSVSIQTYDQAVNLQVTFMKKTGAFAYTKVNQKSRSVSSNSYDSVYEDTYALSGGGHIFYVLLT